MIYLIITTIYLNQPNVEVVKINNTFMTYDECKVALTKQKTASDALIEKFMTTDNAFIQNLLCVDKDVALTLLNK